MTVYIFIKLDYKNKSLKIQVKLNQFNNNEVVSENTPVKLFINKEKV